MLLPFADIVLRAWSVGDLAIAVVIVAAVIALTAIALRQFNVQIPSWVLQVVWVVLVACVVIVAIKFVLSL